MKLFGKYSDREKKRLDGNWKTPRFLRSVLWGNLLLPRSEISRNYKVKAKKCMKKDLMKLVFVSFTRSVFLTFERCFNRQTQDAKLCLFGGKSGCVRLPFDISYPRANSLILKRANFFILKPSSHFFSFPNFS